MIKRDQEEWHDLIVPFQRIYKGDCLERLKEVPDSSVDSVVCDPPYHLTSIVERYSSENAAPAASVLMEHSRALVADLWGKSGTAATLPFVSMSGGSACEC